MCFKSHLRNVHLLHLTKDGLGYILGYFFTKHLVALHALANAKEINTMVNRDGRSRIRLNFEQMKIIDCKLWQIFYKRCLCRHL
jgi:hypothetical protein